MAKNICVYLGAKSSTNPIYEKAVMALGSAIAKEGLTLVYGGSGLGLMGQLAKTVMKKGGNAVGVITKELLETDKAILGEQYLPILTKLIVVETMAERKEKMKNLADAFITLPGGIGTLEEAFDTANHIKLGADKPFVFLNVGNFYQYLQLHWQKMLTEGFVQKTCLQKIHFTSDIKQLFQLLFSMPMVADGLTVADGM